MFDNSQADIGRLIISELNDLKEIKDRVKDAISTRTEQRVSPIERDIQVEPIRGGSMGEISLWYTIDGKAGGVVRFDASESEGKYEQITKERQDTIKKLNEKEWKPFKKVIQGAKSIIVRWKKKLDLLSPT